MKSVRRSDFDVTNTVQVSSPTAVFEAVEALYRPTWPELKLIALQKAFDPKWQSAVPYTVLLAPGGKVLFSTTGSVDVLQLHRKILASVPAEYDGFQRYWTEN